LSAGIIDPEQRRRLCRDDTRGVRTTSVSKSNARHAAAAHFGAATVANSRHGAWPRLRVASEPTAASGSRNDRSP
jgi:hypothetical protein